jgi:hypothetical protein
MATEMEKLQQIMNVTVGPQAAPPVPSKPDEYSGPDGPDGMTIAPEDPTMDSAAAHAPVKPPVTAAQRGRPLPGTQPPQGVVASYPAVTPETAPVAPAPVSGALKLVFTGVSGSGKSTIAKQLGLIELQIQDPIVDLYRRYFPGNEPPADFLNTVLVWGEGLVDPKTPVTPARLLFVDLWRGLEKDLGLDFTFGSQGYWQKRLVQRAAATGAPVAITTCTTNALLEALRADGFQHFHIACSNQTMPTRKRRQGANDGLAVAITNQLVREVSMRPQGQQLPCIWNDTVPAPSPRFLTLETARQALLSTQNSVITGE